MIYNKFIILYTSNFCARISDFFCIEDWISNGYEVEYWDLSAFTCHEKLVDFSVKDLEIKKIKNLREFEHMIKACRHYNALFLTWVNYCWYSAGFYRILSKHNCKYAFLDNGLIPSFNDNNVKKRISFKRIIQSLKNRYYKHISKFLFLKPADYYFQLSDSYLGVDRKSNKTKHGWCNSGDFERNKRIGKVREEKYVVFLDQYIPYHNDNILNGYKQVDPRKYYASLNKCFGFVEDKYAAPVVIAAHPAANRYREDNPFEGRDIIFNKTAELVKGAELVIAHFTTAVSFVVLNEKKMILLTSDAIREVRPLIDEYIVKMADLLGLKCINQDDATINDFEIEEICKEKYNDYKYRYLTNTYSEELSNYENITKIINT